MTPKRKRRSIKNWLRLIPVVVVIALIIVGLTAHRRIRATAADTVIALPLSPRSINTGKVQLVQAETTLPAEKQEQTSTPTGARMISHGYYILIDKSKHQLFLYHDGKLQNTYSVGIGKNTGDKQKVGDMRTPEGHFYIQYIKDSHTWEHDFKDDNQGPVKGAYGPWFMSLYTGKENTFSHKSWTGIAIHGTADPASIGHNVSEGCIRMHNEELLLLKNIAATNPKLPVDVIAGDSK